MRNVFAIITVWLVSQTAIGQSIVHDYMVMSFRPHQNVRELVIDVFGNERQQINLREDNGKGLSMVSLDIQTVFAKVQEYESQGWELVSFNSFTAGADATSEKWIWLFNRPKQ